MPFQWANWSDRNRYKWTRLKEIHDLSPDPSSSAACKTSVIPWWANLDHPATKSTMGISSRIFFDLNHPALGIESIAILNDNDRRILRYLNPLLIKRTPVLKSSPKRFVHPWPKMRTSSSQKDSFVSLQKSHKSKAKIADEYDPSSIGNPLQPWRDCPTNYNEILRKIKYWKLRCEKKTYMDLPFLSIHCQNAYRFQPKRLLI